MVMLLVAALAMAGAARDASALPPARGTPVESTMYGHLLLPTGDQVVLSRLGTARNLGGGPEYLEVSYLAGSARRDALAATSSAIFEAFRPHLERVRLPHAEVVACFDDAVGAEPFQCRRHFNVQYRRHSSGEWQMSVVVDVPRDAGGGGGRRRPGVDPDEVAAARRIAGAWLDHVDHERFEDLWDLAAVQLRGGGRGVKASAVRWAAS